MNKILYAKIIEAFSSVLPITAIVLVATVLLVPIPSGTVLLFIGGAALLVIGMGFFSLGVDMAMMPIGEGLGIQLISTLGKTGGKAGSFARALIEAGAIAFIVIVTFIMGTFVTIAEPDVQVLAEQVSSIPKMTLIITVSVGVGIFLSIAVLRTLLRIPLLVLLVLFYVIIFTITFLSPNVDFLPVAFDAGGISTGPITVPFILALGIGVSSLRGDKNSQGDSFGLVALCVMGPVIALLLLGIFFKPDNSDTDTSAQIAATIKTSRDVVWAFAVQFPQYIKDVIKALGTIFAFFVVFQIISRRYKRQQVLRIVMGFVYTVIGLVLFLVGVNVGFIPVGQLIGHGLGESAIKWVVIPLGMVFGYFIVAAEPAVHVLNKQVEDISSGAVTRKTMLQGLAIGMAAALAITMARILLQIPLLYILLPGYAAALAFTFFIPKIYTGIAFDSGAVCSGPMTATFLLPFAIGVCEGVGGNVMTDAFGIVAMVSMTPILVVQIMGLLSSINTKAASSAAKSAPYTEDIGRIVIYY
jgi:hypothetical protein